MNVPNWRSVCRLPRLLGYAHVKHSVRLVEGGRLEIQDALDRDVFGEGRGGLDVLQELAERVQAEVCVCVCVCASCAFECTWLARAGGAWMCCRSWRRGCRQRCVCMRV